MYGAILGDMIGSPYEFDHGYKSKDFEMFSSQIRYTDDSVMSLARNGHDKAYIRKYIEDEFGYDLRRTCDEIRPTYHHLESCQETVPEAITAFLEGEDFEDVIRTAVSLGGDCDTLTCIAGAMGEAYYDVPEEMKEECDKRLPEELYDILCEFKECIGE